MPLLIAGTLLCRRRRDRLLLVTATFSLLVGVAFFSSYLRLYSFTWLLLPLALVSLLTRWRSLAFRRVVTTLIITAACLEFAASALRAQRISGGGLRVVSGEISAEDYLAGQLNYYPLVQIIDANLPAEARIFLVGSARSAYLPRVCLADYPWDTPWLAQVLREDADPAALVAGLRRAGFTHLLLNADDLQRVENSQRILALADDERRERLNQFLSTLQRVAKKNACYLYDLR